MSKNLLKNAYVQNLPKNDYVQNLTVQEDVSDDSSGSSEDTLYSRLPEDSEQSTSAAAAKAAKKGD